jgi:hypothetical protein
MKKAALFTTFIFCSFLGHAKEPLFLLSSDPVIQEKQAPLKGLRSFVFFPLLKMEEKYVEKTIELIDLELKKVGCIVKKQVLTSEGADLECFSNPTLQFSIEQLVDSNNKLLSILQATLSVRNTAEIGKLGELTSLNTNHWSVYLKKTNDVQKVIKKTLPFLLSQFIAEFQSSHSAEEKPTFYITYDSSWWKDPASK